MRDRTYWFIAQAFVIGISCFIFILCFTLVGKRISYELKWRYMKAILTKDIKWYEKHDVKALPFQVISNLDEVESCAGKTVGFILFAMNIIISCIICGMISGLLLSFCFIAIVPYSFLCFAFQLKINQNKYLEEENAYAVCGSDVEQALSAIKVVKAFNQTSSEFMIYEKHLNESDKNRRKNSILSGIGSGMVESLLAFPLVYAVLVAGFFISEGVNNWMVDRDYRNGDLACDLWCVQSSTYFLGVSLISLQSLNRGLICAGSIFKTIDHVPDINLDDENSIKIDHIDDIIFENVVFKYSDRNQNAVDGISLTFRKGKVTALVGPSGSGKTTIAKLLERFYDPQSGSILVNGTDLRNINLRDYRRLIGYVGQEPCLFNESIKNNLLNANPSATDEDIEECLKTAMAYDFVQKLPEGIESNVGALGNKLSGGQKQRIAIARALIRKPDLLILDEATSALDNRNEKYVQKAIENINRLTNISTIVIAHRLTTIRNADLIIALANGKLVEQGTHEELIQADGHYQAQYSSQCLSMRIGGSIENQPDEHIENNYCDNEKGALIKDDNQIEFGYKSNDIQRGWYQILQRLIPYSKPYSYIFIAVVGVLIGSILIIFFHVPVYKLSYFYSKQDKSEIRKDIAKYVPITFGIGVCVCIVQVVSRYCITYLSSGITLLVRK